MEYFKALPGTTQMADGMDMSNEAEWVVDLTTQADRQNRWVPNPLEHCPRCL